MFLVLLPLGIGSVTTVEAFTTTPLTENNYADYHPQINANGYVAWSGDGNLDSEDPTTDPEIFLYDGTTTTQITDNNSYDAYPQINANGYVVWRGLDGSDFEIFLYDGITTTQLTENNYADYHPQINDNGYVVWFGGYVDPEDPTTELYEIFLYDGITTTPLTENNYADYHPQINDNGLVVWCGGGNLDSEDLSTDYEIFLYDGTTTTQITDNSSDDKYPLISANGHVVWSGQDGSDMAIFLYDGTTTTMIASNSVWAWSPDINANGYVVWEEWDGSDRQIFLYDGTTTTQISNDSGWNFGPDINNNGDVAWTGDANVSDTDTEIFLYDGTTTIQITNDSYYEAGPQINENRYLVWYKEEPSDFEIYLASPVPVIDAGIEGIQPTHGLSDAIVTLRGYNFGDEHISGRRVEMTLSPVTPSSIWTEVPIYDWTDDTQIKWRLPGWTFAPGEYSVRVVTEVGFSNTRTFWMEDHPNLQTVYPDSGSCGTLITLSGNGGFQSAQSKIYADGYHGVHHVVDFASQDGTYTAKNYENWNDTSLEVRLCDAFKDEIDPNTGQRNFVQDDGSGDCADEPTISLVPDTYLAYVRTIYFGDNDSSGELSCGDAIFQVAASNPSGPFQVVPAIDKIGNRKCYPGEKIRIRGSGFGAVQGDSVVHINNKIFDEGSSKIKLWSDTLIKVKIPFKGKKCSWFKHGDGEYRKRKVWVTHEENTGFEATRL